MTEQLRKEIANYNEAILAALGIDDRAFFLLSIWRREKYVQLTKEFADQVFTLIKEALPELAKEAGYVQIRKGDLYFTREQRSAPDWTAEHYKE